MTSKWVTTRVFLAGKSVLVGIKGTDWGEARGCWEREQSGRLAVVFLTPLANEQPLAHHHPPAPAPHPLRLTPPPRFPSNVIKTSKYSVISFLPRSLFEQFRRVANVYFMCISILQVRRLSMTRPHTHPHIHLQGSGHALMAINACCPLQLKA